MNRYFIKPRYPQSIENEWKALLLSIMKKFVDELANTLKSMPELKRTDSLDDVSSRIAAVVGTFGAVFLGYMKSKSSAIFRNIKTFVGNEFKKLNKITGVRLPESFGWDKDELQRFVNWNVSLINKLEVEVAQKLESYILENWSDGMHAGMLAKGIEEITGFAKRRAELIARDQVAKLNARLVELRQTSAGVKEFQWDAHPDCCDECRKLDGKIFEWSGDIKPPLHINCRCGARAHLADFI